MTAIDYSWFFDLSHDLLCVARPDGYFDKVNAAFSRELGWTAEQLVSRPFFDFVHPDDVAATRAELESLSTGLPTLSFENRYARAEGGWARLHWTAFLEKRSGLVYGIARPIR